MSNCNCHTSPNRDGSGRLQRYLTALDPAYAKIDGRSIEDLLVFIKRYAAQVRFFDIPGSTGDNTPDDINLLSWREFFRRDLAVTAASIMLADVTAFKTEFDENRAELEMSPTAHHFGNLFDPILGMVSKLDSWLSLAIPGYPLHDDLLRIIQSGLKPAMKKILAYEEAYKLINPKHPLKLDYTPIQNDSIWGLNEEVIPDASIYTGASVEEKMLSAMLHVDDIFNTFYGIMSNIADDGEKYLEYALEKFPRHQPHMALFIAFLRLFSIVQEQMNGITERMLNFYYRDVLRLEQKPSVPDRVHIVFELAKDIFQYDIAEGTSLNGGMDKSNKKQVYTTNSGLVVNQAKVKELKTIFIQKGEVGDPGTRTMVPSIDAFYARPIANSADGFGEKITDPGGKWPTFGKGRPGLPEKFNPDNPCTFIEQTKELNSRKDQAQIGFAIASPQLLLQGGKRVIQVHIDNLTDLVGTMTVDEANPTSYFQIYLTGEKGWIDAGKLMTKLEYDVISQILKYKVIHPLYKTDVPVHYIDRENSLLFILLPISAEPVVKFDAKTHTGYDITARHPVLRIMLNTEKKLNEAIYSDIKFSNIRLETQVGSLFPDADILPDPESGVEVPDFIETIIQIERLLFFDGLRTFTVQNDETVLAAGKPFDPFTAYPFPGKSFYIGSEEIFNKPLGRLGVSLLKTQDNAAFLDTWAYIAPEDAGSTDKAEYAASILQERSWRQLAPFNATTAQFTQLRMAHNILYTLANPLASGVKFSASSMMINNPKHSTAISHPRLPIEQNITEWSQKSNKGFIRITNITPFDKGSLGTMQQSQDMAADMQIKEVSLSYYSDLSPLEAGTDQFFHIYPFGAAETYINPPVIPAAAEADVKDGMQEVVVVSSGSRLRINRDSAFNTADKAANYLMVQANNKLLPQFTWKSSYDDYNAQTKEEAGYVKGNGMQLTGARKSAFDYENVVAYGSGIRSLRPGNNQYSNKIEEEGMLFIGLEKLEPLQTVSMLFQFADGSAEDEDQDPPEIHWSYLTNNEWRPMSGENIVSDGTYGFQATGIIKFDVPADVTTNNTIITGGLVWFMASVTQNANRIPMLVDVVTQAVEATFIDNDNDQSHFDEALPAGTIGKLSVAVAEVSKVAQPFASFDGKHKETGKEYYIRVSERLRHKGRAINVWDYEHLVLNRFPSIYKVKAINHLDPECLCRNVKATVAPVVVVDAEPVKETVTLDMIYNSDANFSTEDEKALNELIVKTDLKVVKSITLTALFITTAEAETAEKAQEQVKQAFINKGGSPPSLISIEKAVMGASRKVTVSILQQSKAKAAEATVLVTTYNLAYIRSATGGAMDFDAASQQKINTAVLQLKNDPTFTADLKIFFNTDVPKTMVDTLLKTTTDQIAASGITAARFKGEVVTGTSGTAIMNVYKPVVETPPAPVPVNKNICCGPQIAPGHVLIVPIADLKNRNAVNPLQPKTGRRTLLEIEAYLQKRTSPFVKVHAKNPVYEQIMVAFRVKFYTGTDKGFYLKKLNEEIVHFLTPWAFDETADVKFGGEVYSSSIINFIEERPYVDFITDFFMFVCRDECCPPSQKRLKERDTYQEEQTPAEILSQFCNCTSFEELLQSDFDGLVVARPSTPRSILVSVPKHIIVPYEEPQRPSDCEKRKSQKALGPKPELPQPAEEAPVKPKAANPAPAKTVVAPSNETAKPKDGSASLEIKKPTPVKPAAAKKAAPKTKKKPNK